MKPYFTILYEDGDDEKVFKQPKLEQFFVRKRKRGQPRKANTASDIEEGKPKSKKKKTLETVAISTSVKPKVTRTNWAKGDNKTKMDWAVKDWLEKQEIELIRKGKLLIEWIRFVVLSKCH